MNRDVKKYDKTLAYTEVEIINLFQETDKYPVEVRSAILGFINAQMQYLANQLDPEFDQDEVDSNLYIPPHPYFEYWQEGYFQINRFVKSILNKYELDTLKGGINASI